MAGDNAGVKNRCNEFSMPINAAAIATRLRKGSMMRVSVVASSSLPGTSLKCPANNITSGAAKMIPIVTRSPVTISSALNN